MLMHAVYASTSGNVEVVVETVAKLLEASGINVELHRSEQTSIEVFRHNELFLIATSTWEHGVLNPFFQPLHQEMSKEDFAGKKAAFIGLGDTRYEPVLFCQGMEILKQTWTDNQGQQLFHNLKINGEPYHLLDTTVTEWTKGLIDALETDSSSEQNQSNPTESVTTQENT